MMVPAVKHVFYRNSTNYDVLYNSVVSFNGRKAII